MDEGRPDISTEALLTAGADARIRLDPATGLNRYGCPPRPDPELAAFGSSTASVISSSAFAAADALRQRLFRGGRPPSPAALEREAARLRDELVHLCGCAGLPGLRVHFAPSGTDLHCLAARLAGAAADQPLTALLIDPEETGRGVPAALAGCSPCGGVAPGEGARVETVVVRWQDGTPIPVEEVDGDFLRRAILALERGQRLLLVMVDVSKTGLAAPSPSVAAALRQQFPGQVDVLVDACQFRVTPYTLRAYLEQGFMVAVTGSKFITGPTFSGALFVPSPLQGRCSPGEDLPAPGGAGWLLRWEAALEELRAFNALPQDEVASFFQTFAGEIGGRLAAEPAFEPLHSPLPARHGGGWDRIPTIFPFILRRPGGSGWNCLGREESARIYGLLQQDLRTIYDASTLRGWEDTASLRCQFGQPVNCGSPGGRPASALRLCASARLAVEAVSGGGRGQGMVIERALQALEKAARLTRLA